MLNDKKTDTKKDARKSVFGIYESESAVDRAVDQLKAEGFRNADISVLMPTKEGTQNFAHEKNTKAPEGATSGAVAGVAIGGGLGWLVGLGALAIPGVGPFVAAGPIMSALAGAGLGGTVGGIAGALIGMGIPEFEAKRYESYVKEGGVLLSVHVDDSDWQAKAKRLLEATGARDVATTGEVKTLDEPREHIKEGRDTGMTGTRDASLNAGLRTDSSFISSQGGTDVSQTQKDQFRSTGI